MSSGTRNNKRYKIAFFRDIYLQKSQEHKSPFCYPSLSLSSLSLGWGVGLYPVRLIKGDMKCNLSTGLAAVVAGQESSDIRQEALLLAGVNQENLPLFQCLRLAQIRHSPARGSAVLREVLLKWGLSTSQSRKGVCPRPEVLPEPERKRPGFRGCGDLQYYLSFPSWCGVAISELRSSSSPESAGHRVT